LTDRNLRHYEELAVGEEHALGEYDVSREEIIEFASEWDPQPFHVDEAAAEESMFGELVASGLHTLCICHRVAAGGFYQDAAVLGGLGMEHISFPEPVRPCDTLTVSMQVTDKQPHGEAPDLGRVDMEFTVTNQDGEPVLTNLVKTLVGRRDPA